MKPLYQLLLENEAKQKELEKENLSLKIALVESEELRLMDSLETKLALAELAEAKEV